jgi:uroporphyrinogen decarboxylase
MTSRERVLATLNFRTPDRVPLDLAGMRSTGISCFAYPQLIAALGLPPRRPLVYDSGQMLALPEVDVLDALGCDVITLGNEMTNAFPQPELWHDYDFNGRLAAKVRNPASYVVEADGTIVQNTYLRMPPSAFVFESEHAGQPLDLSTDLPKPDLKVVREQALNGRIKDADVKRIVAICRRVRESTDRAVFAWFDPLIAGLSIDGWGGLAVFPVLCLLEPDLVHELHTIQTDRAVYNTRMLLPEIAPYIDVLINSADDWGTQGNLIASPQIYRDLFLPYYRKANDACHAVKPDLKIFLHSCGAIYNLLDLIIESGFDIVNPVQWPAGGHSPREWQQKCRKRIALWGGGVNSQATLPLGTVAEVEAEVRQVVRDLTRDNGYVFCNIHNIMAEITAEKVVAMYRAAQSV